MQSVVVTSNTTFETSSDAARRIRELLAENGAGEYVEGDMAIDGGDAEAILRGRIPTRFTIQYGLSLEELSCCPTSHRVF